MLNLISGQRLYSIPSRFGDEDVASRASGDGGAFRNDGSVDFFGNVSRQLETKCLHKFWA